MLEGGDKICKREIGLVLKRLSVHGGGCHLSLGSQ